MVSRCGVAARLWCLVVAGVAAAAVAPTAFAGSENPSFPNGDDSASEWSGVTIHEVGSASEHCEPTLIEPCEFVAESESSTLELGGVPQIDCHVRLEVDIFSDGFTLVEEFDTSPGVQAACDTFVGEDLPWPNQICEYEHAEPMQFWDRVEVNFHSVALGVDATGELFADVSSGTEASVNSAIHAGPFAIRAQHNDATSAPYEFFDHDLDDEPTTIDIESDPPTPCPWPEFE